MKKLTTVALLTLCLIGCSKPVEPASSTPSSTTTTPIDQASIGSIPKQQMDQMVHDINQANAADMRRLDQANLDSQ